MEITKLYYSIGEVSRITDIESHVLRYWETEFRELSPRKNRGGKRLYRENDIKTVMRIKELLYGQRFTIEGARKKLSEPDITQDEPNTDLPLGDQLRDIKRGLTELKQLLK